MRSHYCNSTTAGCTYSQHYSMKLSLQTLYCLFPLMHYNISVSLEKKPLTVIALLHWSAWKWIFKCKSPSTFSLPHSSPLPPRSNLNRNVVTALLVIPLIMWWNGKTQKHLFEIPVRKRLVLWTAVQERGTQFTQCSQNNWRSLYRTVAGLVNWYIHVV